MTQAILDEVVFLFVEQYDNLYGLLTDRADIKRIRQSADDSEAALYSVVVSVFGDRLDEVLAGAAYGAMDYIAYVDETWIPRDIENKKKTLETEALHLEALKAILRMAQVNGRSVTEKILALLTEAENHFQHLRARKV